MNTHAPPIHVFSYETKVSLEVPADWSELLEQSRAVIYGCDDPATQATPKFVVKTIALPVQTSGADQSILDSILQTAGVIDIVRARDSVEVDGFAGQRVIFTLQPPGMPHLLVQHQVVVLVEQVVFSLTGVVEAAAQATWLPQFEKIVRSVRFIPA